MLTSLYTNTAYLKQSSERIRQSSVDRKPLFTCKQARRYLRYSIVLTTVQGLNVLEFVEGFLQNKKYVLLRFFCSSSLRYLSLSHLCFDRPHCVDFTAPIALLRMSTGFGINNENSAKSNDHCI